MDKDFHVYYGGKESCVYVTDNYTAYKARAFLENKLHLERVEHDEKIPKPKLGFDAVVYIDNNRPAVVSTSKSHLWQIAKGYRVVLTDAICCKYNIGIFQIHEAFKALEEYLNSWTMYMGSGKGVVVPKRDNVLDAIYELYMRRV